MSGALLSLFLMQSCLPFAREGVEEPVVVAPANRVPLPARALADDAPEKQAAYAAGRGDFRLIHVEYDWYETSPGVTCVLYPASRREIRHIFRLTAEDSAGDSAYKAQVEDYSRRYNQTVVRHMAYPDYDVCRSGKEGWVTALPSPSDMAEFLDWKGDPAKSGEQSSLSRAVRFGHQEALRRYLDKGENPDQTDPWGMSPLDWASSRGRTEMVGLLLAHKARVDFNRKNQALPGQGGDGRLAGMNSSLYWALLAGRMKVLEKLVGHLHGTKEGCEIADELAPAVLLAAENNRGPALEIMLSGSDALKGCQSLKKALGEALAIVRSNDHAILEKWLLAWQAADGTQPQKK